MDDRNPGSIDLYSFSWEYIDSYDHPRKSSATMHTVRMAFRHPEDGLFEIEMRGKNLLTTAELTEAVVAEVVRRMMNRNARRIIILDRLRVLRRVCEYAIHWGYLEAVENPVDARRVDEYRGTGRDLPHIAERESSRPTWIPAHYDASEIPEPDLLTTDQLTRLMAHLLAGSATWEGHRLYSLVALVVYAGLKTSEALETKVGDFDLKLGVLRISKHRIAIDRRFRHLPPKLVEIISDWLPRTRSTYVFPGKRLKGPWTSGPQGGKPLDAVRAAGVAVGIEGLTLERLREYSLNMVGCPDLGPEFTDLPVPVRGHRGPPAVRPGTPKKSPPERPGHMENPAPAGPRPAKRSPVLQITDDNYPIVRGVLVDRRLTEARAAVLRVMIEAGQAGEKPLRKSDLQERTRGKVGDPLATLRALRKIDELADVIVFPGKQWRKGYRLAAE